MAHQPGNFFLRVFEAHIFADLNLQPNLVEAVFLPSPRLLTPKIREEILPDLHRLGIDVQFYGMRRQTVGEINATPADLQPFVTDWVCRRMANQGGLA